MSNPETFEYEVAFGRNIGWVTDWEQQILKTKRVAIAGVGGVGGVHLLTLARLGIGHFNIADFDTFEMSNFNRQVGAMMSTLGEGKVQAMEQLVTDINPQLEIRKFENGITLENIDDFLSGVDVFVDGLDAFALEIRAALFKRCHELGIPAVTAAPLGFGTAYLIFMPGGMTFEEYFNFSGLDQEKRKVNFFLGLNPKFVYAQYVADCSKINLPGGAGPSTPMGCNLCAVVAGAATAKILLGRGKIYAAPWFHCFDPYANRWILGYLPQGNKNLSQRIPIAVASLLHRVKINPPIDWVNQKLKYDGTNAIECILDLARWTPSGDNAQPWRFQIINGEEVLIHFHREGSIYDYCDIPSRMTIGMFIENLRIAATRYHRELDWQFIPGENGNNQVKVRFNKTDVSENELCGFIKIRTVDRFAYQMTSLKPEHRAELTAAITPDFEILWFEDFQKKWALTDAICLATDIRLKIPEAFKTHQKLFDYENRFSVDRIPSVSAGTSLLTTQLSQWALGSWGRLHFLNTYFGGTMLPTIETSLIPGIFTSAYFMIVAKNIEDLNRHPDVLLSAGQNVQRFWLTISKLGMVMQPSVATLALGYYAKNNIPYTKDLTMMKRSHLVTQKLEAFAPINRIAFLGRVGYPFHKAIRARSIRKSLDDLIIKS